MNDPISDRSTYEEIQREHEELGELLGDVTRTLAKRLVSVSQVAEMIGTLVEQLEQHFDEEETGGFFDQIVSQTPRHAERCKSLREEHTWLLASIRELNEQASLGDDSDDWWQRLESKFHEFSKELMQHESKENELVQKVYTEDIGPAD
jgi:iron-sulfur cluster repair protein YtfE (RIC family)